MVSSKERIRIGRHIDKLIERNNRQKDALTRMVAGMTEMTAALAEIADMKAQQHDVKDARERAQAALDSVAAKAAAGVRIEGESTDGEDPTTDEEVSSDE